MSKFYLMWDAAWKSRTDAALVRIVVPVDGKSKADEDRADQLAKAFVNVLMPALSRFLPD